MWRLALQATRARPSVALRDPAGLHMSAQAAAAVQGLVADPSQWPAAAQAPGALQAVTVLSSQWDRVLDTFDDWNSKQISDAGEELLADRPDAAAWLHGAIAACEEGMGFAAQAPYASSTDQVMRLGRFLWFALCNLASKAIVRSGAYFEDSAAGHNARAQLHNAATRRAVTMLTQSGDRSRRR